VASVKPKSGANATVRVARRAGSAAGAHLSSGRANASPVAAPTVTRVMALSPNRLPSIAAERSPWLRGTIRVPGDRAPARLALLLSALARGESVLEQMPSGPETAALVAAVTTLGATVARRNDRLHIGGVGVGFLPPTEPIAATALGAAAPLLLALLAAHDFPVELTGLEPHPVTTALLGYFERNGVRVEVAGDTTRICGPRFTIPLDLGLPAEALALKAPLLLEALLIPGRSRLHLPTGAPDSTELMLTQFGVRCAITEAGEGIDIEIEGPAPLRAQALALAGDATLATYPAVAALITPDSEVTIEALSPAPGSMAVLDALGMMGADLSLTAGARTGSADLTVRHSRLSGAVIPADLGVAPEDFPILSAAAAFAEGETLLEGLGQGQRRLAITRALRVNGIECEERENGLAVYGMRSVPGGGNIFSRLDPRLAMAFLVLGMGAERPVTIDDGAAVADVFPDFVTAFEHIGASFILGDKA
jgi:3-phosphoshikimate 1-carboxyvinyltransferase